MADGTIKFTVNNGREFMQVCYHLNEKRLGAHIKVRRGTYQVLSSDQVREIVNAYGRLRGRRWQNFLSCDRLPAMAHYLGLEF